MNRNIILVGHDTEISGASHYIYMLYIFLKNKYTNFNIYLCLPYPNNNKKYEYNSIIFEKYKINKGELLEYDNNPDILKKLYDKFYQALLVI